MTRQAVVAFSTLSITKHISSSKHLTRTISSHSHFDNASKEGEIPPTERFLAALDNDVDPTPKAITKITYSKGSGPGGMEHDAWVLFLVLFERGNLMKSFAEAIRESRRTLHSMTCGLSYRRTSSKSSEHIDSTRRDPMLSLRSQKMIEKRKSMRRHASRN